MLKLLRNRKTQKQIYIFLAIVVTLSFVLSGLIMNDEDSPTTLGRIDGKKVSLKAYLDSYRAVEHQAEWVYGRQFREIRKFLNLKGEAWDRLLLLNEAKRRGLKTGDDEVVSWITTQPPFVSNGAFNEQAYKFYVQNYLRVTTREFEEETRGLLTIQKLFKDLRSAAKVEEAEVRAAYDAENGALDMLYGLIGWQPLVAGIPIDENDINKTYEAMKDQMKKPDGSAMTPEEAKAQLRENARRSKAMNAAADKAAKLHEKADTAHFEEALKAEGVEVKTLEKHAKGGDIPGVGVNKLIDEALFVLKEGDVSQPLTASTGTVLAKVTKRHAADPSKFDEQKKTIQEKLEAQKSDEAMRKLLEGLRDKLAVNAEAMNKIFPPTEQS